MFKDTKKELERLQAQLLAEEETQVIQLPEEYAEEPPAEEDDNILFEELEEYDDFDEELAEIQAMLGQKPRQPLYQNFPNNYGRSQSAQVYNTDKVEEDLDLDEYSEEVYEEKPESLKGLVITACLLLAGIAGVLVWWAVRFL